MLPKLSPILISFLIAVSLVDGCSSIHWKRPNFNADQKRYLDRAMRQPLDFEIPKEIRDEAWSRAQVFLAHYCPLKIQLASDYVCFTFTDEKNYSWRITRELKSDSALFDVACMKADGLGHECQSSAVSLRNAHIAAYFIATGERVPDGVIWPGLRQYDRVQVYTANPFHWGEYGDPWGDFECGAPAAPEVALTPLKAPKVSLPEAPPVFNDERQGGHTVLRPQISFPEQVRNWTLCVYSTSTGVPKLIRTQKGEGRVPETLDWDGRDDSGAIQGEGVYPASLEVRYDTGQTAADTQIQLEISNHYPEITWKRGPFSFDKKRPSQLLMPSEFDVTAGESRLPCRWKFEVAKADDSTFRTFTGKVTPKFKIVWDGKDESGAEFISNTHYRFTFQLLDDDGNLVKAFPTREWNCVFPQ
jgi:hypothetical protein